MSPSKYPDLALPKKWQERFTALVSEGALRTEALRTISGEYGGVGVTTIRRYIFRRDFLLRTKRNSEEWVKKRDTDPSTRNSYAAKYMTARNHIDHHVVTAYERVGRTPLTLQELSDLVADTTQIHFRPTALLTLSTRHESRHGTPLLEKLQGEEGTVRYALYQTVKSLER